MPCHRKSKQALAGFKTLGFEPRISSAVLIAGAAHFKGVLSTSDEEGASKLRSTRMKTYSYKDLEE